MFYQLLINIKSFVVNELIDNEWSRTLSLLRTGGLNPVFAATSQGTISERVARFSKLKALGAHTDEDHKLFMQGLVVTGALGRTIFCETAADIDRNPYIFKDFFEQLIRTNCFSGTNKDECISYFLDGMFARDNNGVSAFLFALRDTKYNSFQLVLKVFKQIGCFSGLHRLAFVTALKEDNYFYFREAAQKIDTYQLLRDALRQSCCVISGLRAFLNTKYEINIYGIHYWATPLMHLIYKTALNPPTNYSDFTALLLLFCTDGAQLTAEQAQSVRENLHQIKYQSLINISNEHWELLDEWINAIKKIEVCKRRSDVIYGKTIATIPHKRLFSLAEEKNDFVVIDINNKVSISY